MADSANPLVGKTGLAGTFVVFIAKDNAAEVSIAPTTILDRGHGWYEVHPSASTRDTLGETAWTFTAPGAIDFPRLETVIAADNQLVAWGAATPADVAGMATVENQAVMIAAIAEGLDGQQDISSRIPDTLEDGRIKAVVPAGTGDVWTEEEKDYVLAQLALLEFYGQSVVIPAGVFMCGRGDIEQIFGTVAVSTWADLNNNGDEAEIEARINYRIAMADNYIKSTLANGPWVMPVEGDIIPITLAVNCAALAGVYLYEGRGVQDYNPSGHAQHQLSFHKTNVENFIKGVLVGTISLAPLPYNIQTAAPQTVGTPLTQMINGVLMQSTDGVNWVAADGMIWR